MKILIIFLTIFAISGHYVPCRDKRVKTDQGKKNEQWNRFAEKRRNLLKVESDKGYYEIMRDFKHNMKVIVRKREMPGRSQMMN